jgi:hypothetical protein
LKKRRSENADKASFDRFYYRRIYRAGVCRISRHAEMKEVSMEQVADLDRVRTAALARIDRTERNFKLAFYGALFVESAFIVSFLLLADLSNRLHLLLLIATVSCYSIVVLGLFALGAYINRGLARVLKAVELGPERD